MTFELEMITGYPHGRSMEIQMHCIYFPVSWILLVLDLFQLTQPDVHGYYLGFTATHQAMLPPTNTLPRNLTKNLSQNLYSETHLIQTPMGHAIASILTRYPY